MEAWGCYAAYRKQEDIKNVDHMMVNYDIATVEEFTWPHIRMERLFLQFIKNKLSSLDKFRPLNYHKTLNEKFPPLTCLVWIPARPCKGGRGTMFNAWIMSWNRKCSDTCPSTEAQVPYNEFQFYCTLIDKADVPRRF